tara:strand:- start:5223 stop:6149 length:927 start_codon:yes stop_codon:yes gene_type:complete
MFIKKPIFWDSKNFSAWPIILYPFSIIYLFLFNLIIKLKKKQTFEVPIICVGNIYLGGTGKTPLVKEIYNILISIGKKPAIIKKYYNYIEDEISLLETTSKVFSDKNRLSSIRKLIQDKFDTAIMDDGFQDYSIKKDFSILCFNEKQWIGNGLVLPAGPLREGLNSLKKANCVFINGEKNLKIENQINKIYKSNIFYFKYIPKNIEKFTNKKIIAFAGIGNPVNFFELLKKNNLNLVDSKTFPDHYIFSDKDMDNLIMKAKNNDAILLTTEKDYFRIKDNYKINIEKLEIDLKIENQDHFIKLLKENL